MALEVSLYTSVEGPRGRAEIYRLVSDGYFRVDFELRFQGTTQRFAAEGEAVLVAEELTGKTGQTGPF